MKIKDLQPGMDNVEFEAIISQVTIGKTNGAKKSNYLNLTLQDDSSVLDAKLWNASEEDINTFVQGCVIKCKGDIIKYNTSRQMKVIKAVKLDVSEVKKTEYLPKAPVDKGIMMKSIKRIIDDMTDHDLKVITSTLIEENKEAFMLFPAASRNHHDFISGLLYHTYCMLNIAKGIAIQYHDLNQDLLYAGVILHDIGKVKELSGPITPHYSVEGNLIGHISIGFSMIQQVAVEKNLHSQSVLLLEHMVLSHHGKNEYGSPVLPQIKEAEILSLVDNIDARMNMFEKAEQTIEAGEFSKRIFPLENRQVFLPQK